MADAGRGLRSGAGAGRELRGGRTKSGAGRGLRGGRTKSGAGRRPRGRAGAGRGLRGGRTMSGAGRDCAAKIESSRNGASHSQPGEWAPSHSLTELGDSFGVLAAHNLVR